MLKYDNFYFPLLPTPFIRRNPFALHLPHSWQAEVTEYYLFVTLWMMGNYGANVLLPLFLLSNGYSLAQIVIVYLINEVSLIFFLFFTSTILKRWGFRIVLAFGILVFTAFLMLLTRLEHFHDFWSALPFLAVVFALRGFGKAFLNFGHEVFMIKVATMHSGGKSVSWFRICMIVASVLTPAVVGVTAYVYGFDIAFFCLAVLSALSMIPLFLIPNHRFQIKYKPKSLVPLLRTRIKKRYIFAEVGRSFADGVIFLTWPVFVYLAVENVKDVGFITSASAFLSIIVAYLVGKSLQDSKRSEGIFRHGVRISAFFYFLRAAFPTPILLVLVDAFNRICESVVQVNYETRCYRYLRSLSDQNKIEIVHVRCLVIECVYVLALVYVLVVALLFETPTPMMFVIMFAFAAATILLMTQILAVRSPILAPSHLWLKRLFRKG